MRRVLHHAAVALLIATAACRPEFQGQEVAPPREQPAFTFTTATGAPVSTGPSGDQLTVLLFGYTHCPDICPTTLADWKRVRSQLGADTTRVRFLFVSIDPGRDTPIIAQQYVATYHPSFIGLAGDSATTAQMMQAFGVAVMPAAAPATAPAMPGMDHGDGGALLGHSSQTFLLNAKGQLVAIYASGTGWQALLADLRALL